MNKKCCGKQVKDKFCGECGKLMIINNPGYYLLEYLNTVIKGKETYLRSYKSYITTDFEYKAKMVDSLKKKIEKWKSWQLWVKNAVEREQNE